MANVTSLDGATPSADLQLYASGYTCVPSNPVAVTLDAPRSATAEGEADLVCTPDNSHEDDYETAVRRWPAPPQPT